MKRYALSAVLLVPVLGALVACGDAPPSYEELESSGALTNASQGQNATKGDGGACRLQGSTNIVACDQCAQQQCCEIMNACNADPACLAADTCIAHCDQLGYAAQKQGDPNLAANWQACYDNCTKQNPTAMQQRQLAVQCVPTKCSAYCPKNAVQ